MTDGDENDREFGVLVGLNEYFEGVDEFLETRGIYITNAPL